MVGFPPVYAFITMISIAQSLNLSELTDDSNGPPDHSESMFITTFSAPGAPNGIAIHSSTSIFSRDGSDIHTSEASIPNWISLCNDIFKGYR